MECEKEYSPDTESEELEEVETVPDPEGEDEQTDTDVILMDLVAKELCVEDIIFDEEQECYYENMLSILMGIVNTEIKRLPVTQQDVVVRHFIMEESLRTIAKNIGIKWYAVQQRKERAVSTLRRRLKDNPYAQDIYTKLIELDPPVSLLAKIAEFLGK